MVWFSNDGGNMAAILSDSSDKIQKVLTIWKPESNTYSIEIFPVLEVWYSDFMSGTQIVTTFSCQLEALSGLFGFKMLKSFF